MTIVKHLRTALMMVPVAVLGASIPSFSGLAQDTGTTLEVEDVIRQLKPTGLAPGVRTRGLPVGAQTRGLPGRGISVEMPASSSTDPSQGPNQDPPSIDLSIEFDFNSHSLTSEGEASLHVLGKALTSEDLTDYRFLIAGHTDAVGGEGYNQILSELRAQAVKEFLIDRYHVVPNRLVAEGFGESRLLKPDEPDADVNRRVQITNLGEN